jgi:hypothetical protein
LSSKKKNNHFVPRSYLRRFRSRSEKELSLYNIKSDQTVENAPIKSQASRDYFYTKNAKFENLFESIETEQKSLLDEIIATRRAPEPGTKKRRALSFGLAFQAGRTAKTAAYRDRVYNELGKTVLRLQFEKEGRTDILEYLTSLTSSWA